MYGIRYSGARSGVGGGGAPPPPPPPPPRLFKDVDRASKFRGIHIFRAILLSIYILK